MTCPTKAAPSTDESSKTGRNDKPYISEELQDSDDQRQSSTEEMYVKYDNVDCPTKGTKQDLHEELVNGGGADNNESEPVKDKEATSTTQFDTDGYTQ